MPRSLRDGGDALFWYEGAGLSDRRSLHVDHQGSVIASANTGGTLRSINRYDEYGTVRKWRSAVAISDALLFCSPEYAGGVSGVLKNALEWLVGDVAAYKKPAAVINAAPRAHHADNSLRLILTTMGIRLVEASSVSIALSGRKLDAMGIANDTRLADQLKEALTRLAAEAKRPGL